MGDVGQIRQVCPPDSQDKASPYCTHELNKQKNRKPKVDEDANNLTITKGKFPHGTILRIQCAAIGTSGRCDKQFTVSYDPQRTVYPKYCPLHRNAYQRARFEGTIK